MLPRYTPVRQLEEKPDPSTGRYHLTTYQSHPFYNKPGFLNRWGPEAWFVWFSGGKVPGSDGDTYWPQGYIWEDVGPRVMRGKGVDEARGIEERLKVERTAGCPFAFAR